MPPKKPVDNILQLTTKTISKTYSVQKSTYKGWAAFYKALGKLTKDYSEQLLKLSQTGGNYIGLKDPLPQCEKYENVVVKTMIGEVLHTASTLSQIQFNFSQKLMEMSESYTHMYEQIRKRKDHFMETLQQTYPKQLSKTVPREKAELRVLKGLHDMADSLEEDEISRIQRIRENSIIFYNTCKVIADREQQFMASSSMRLAKMEIESQRKDLSKLVNDIADIYNGYGVEQKLKQKNSKLVQSLRQSMKLTKVNSVVRRQNQTKDALKRLQQEVQQLQGQLEVPLSPLYQLRRGLLSKTMKQYYSYGSMIKHLVVNSVAYSMFESFYLSAINEGELKSFARGVKVRMKLNESTKPCQSQTGSLKQYLEMEFEKRSEEQRRMVIELIYLHMYHAGQINQQDFNKNFYAVKNSPATINQLPKLQLSLNVWVSAAILQSLVQTLFRSKQEQIFLIDGYPEVYRMIQKFGKDFLKIEPQLVLMLFLKRVLKNNQLRDQLEIHPNIRQLDNLWVTDPSEVSSVYGGSTEFTLHLRDQLRNKICRGLCQVYKPDANLHLHVQILQWLDIYFCSKVAVETIQSCLRVAGYRYLLSRDPDRNMFGIVWESLQKLKILSHTVRNNQFILIDQKILQPLAGHISKVFGINLELVKKQVRQRFYGVILYIILENTKTIDTKGLEDPDGYALLLGIELCKLDQLCTQSLISYSSYFDILNLSLASTQKQYRDLLGQTTTTELWLVEEDMPATQNCIDFCALLAKPIEFMTKILKELSASESKQSEFRDRFVKVVKLKLNEILKSEIIKYCGFLESSVSKLNTIDPYIQIQPRKVESVSNARDEPLIKSFRDLFRRLNNMLFVKHQLSQILKDILDQDRISDVFDTQKLQAEISRASDNQSKHDLLLILRKVARDVAVIQQRVLERIGKGVVYTYLKKFFERLYYRQEKGTFEQIFGNDKDVKLSEYTFMKSKEQLDEVVGIIVRAVPSEYINKLLEVFYNALYHAAKYQIINCWKFRVPLPIETIFNYLNTDLANIVAALKRYGYEDIINKSFYVPLRKVLDDLKEQPPKLFSRFEQAMVSKNKREAEQVLSVLNLRCQEKDKKIKEYVKSYKQNVQR